MKARNLVLAAALLVSAFLMQACAGFVAVRPMPVCAGTLTQEYGWRPLWSGNGVEYGPTGRWICSGQLLPGRYYRY